ncbi:MAG TPA: helix-turn-helix transcriptional regulator [Thermoanaerobaculia bacterium]|nr:helix-turn-helix transcriptional regulator [Thermoanaerobaculia bacterium]
MTRRIVRSPKRAVRDEDSAGDLLRRARIRGRLTQHELADRLGCSQQAIAQAERSGSNPTVGFMRRWAAACGARLVVRIRPRSR